jgi:hypothetical protein
VNVKRLFGSIALLFLIAVPLVRGQETPKNLIVGAIDFFGVQGMDTAPILKALPIQSGQVLEIATMDSTISAVRKAVHAASGLTVTSVEAVCCDVKDTYDFYIGLPGSSYRLIKHAATPTKGEMLPPEALQLYKQDLDMVQEAIEHGAGGEDDSKGYALTKYPAAQKIQLAMRAYAVSNTAEVERVLRQSEYSGQRQASAMLLGYSDRSAETVAALAAAANDADSEVRNNATRALEVMQASGSLKGLDATPFIELLYSGDWSDRNKASILLYRVTESRDPALLLKLKDAMGPLIDGARWHSEGHAEPFLVILGRMGGISKVRLQALIDAGAKDEIIAAAQKQ